MQAVPKNGVSDTADSTIYFSFSSLSPGAISRAGAIVIADSDEKFENRKLVSIVMVEQTFMVSRFPRGGAFQIVSMEFIKLISESLSLVGSRYSCSYT